MTPPVTFEPHARYVLHGSGYQVLQLLDDGTLVVRNLTTNSLMTHRLTELWQAWQDNTLEFAREGPNLHHSTETALKTAYNIADLADLPTQLQDITWHRYQLLLPLIPMSSPQRTKQVIEERIRTYLFSSQEEKIPGREAFLLSLAHARDTSAQQEASAGAAPTPLQYLPTTSSHVSYGCQMASSLSGKPWRYPQPGSWFPPISNAVPNTTVSIR
jgi:hypothetical protein